MYWVDPGVEVEDYEKKEAKLILTGETTYLCAFGLLHKGGQCVKVKHFHEIDSITGRYLVHLF